MTLQSKIDGMQWQYDLAQPSAEWCFTLEAEIGRATKELGDAMMERALADFHRQQLQAMTAQHYIGRIREALGDD